MRILLFNAQSKTINYQRQSNLRIKLIPALCVICGIVFYLQSINAAAIQNSADTVLEKIPLAFEKNVGQSHQDVQYLALGSGYRLYLTPKKVMVQLFDKANNSHTIGMRFDGGNNTPDLIGGQELKRKTHYYLGESEKEHITNVPNYKSVKYKSVYPGIDAVFYGKNGFLEYDLLLSPNVSPGVVKVEFSGAKSLRVSEAGKLVLSTDIGEVAYESPVAYQEINGERHLVSAKYEKIEKNVIGYKLGKYDPSLPLVIDPILSYSTFVLGGNDIAVDASGNVYIAGLITSSYDYPLDGYKSKSRGDTSAFIMKLNETATDILYAAYIGARRSSTKAEAIGIDAQGNAYIAGSTDSSNYPVTSGSYQTEYSPPSGFVTKLNSSGDSLVYSTYIHGAEINDIKVTDAGDVLLAGRRSSSSFVATPGAYNTSSGFGVIAKLNPAGSAMGFATYFDQACSRLAIDGDGNVYVTGDISYPGMPTVNPAQSSYAGGNEAFVSKLNSAGSALIYSTYLGGAADEFAGDIAVNNNGEAYVVGRTHSTDFPVTPGVFQPSKATAGENLSNAFITKLSSTGYPFLFSTYLGGKWCPPGRSCFGLFEGEVDYATEVEVDALGYAYIAGYTKAYDFPLVNHLHAIGLDNSDTSQSPFITKIKPDGDRIVYSWVLGNQGSSARATGLALDQFGSAYLMGITGFVYPGDFFPLTGGSPLIENTFSFVSKVSTGKYPTVVDSSNNPADASQQITFSADVQSATAGGDVKFFANGIELGTVPIGNGGAELTTSLPAGGYEITAVYSSDGITSPPIYQVITSP